MTIKNAIAPGAVVTIHTGTRQYDVTLLDTSTRLDLAMVCPRDPSDPREGQWVSLDLLHVVPPAKVGKPGTVVYLTDQERRYLALWLRTQMTDEAESLLLKLEG